MSTVGQGAAQGQDKSTETFVTALILNAAIGGAELLAFLILRQRFKTVYEPRATLKPYGPKQDLLPSGLLSVIPAVFRAKDEDIIRHNGMDAYLYVRFSKLLFYFFLPTAILTWAVLLPIYGTGSNGNQQLNKFTFGNIGRDQQPRLAAPLILIWIMTLGLLWLIRREWISYISKRKEFLTSRGWMTKPQSKTVLMTGIPDEYASIEAIQSLTNHLEGGVAHIWLAKDVKELAELYERQMKAAKKLESANLKVIKTATKLVKKGKVPAEGKPDASEDGSLALKYLPAKKIPHHRLGKIPFVGTKVETIDWAEGEIEETRRLLEAGRERPDKYEPKASAFILFNDMIDAHVFAQKLGEKDQPMKLKLCKRYINCDPEDVVWSNLDRKPLVNKAMKAVSLAVTTLIIIFYTVITTFVTGISNVNRLCTLASWLGWLCNLPTPINGIIQGALPPIALAVVFMLVPIIFRLLLKLEGIPLRSQIEWKLERRYGAFLIIQGFIVGTLSSGIVASISEIIDNPGSAVNLLAQNLPGAATFFITLILVSALTKAGGAILQVVKLLLYTVKVKLLGGNPRSLQKARHAMPQAAYGVQYPNQLLLAVIALSYASIAPLVCGFAALGFFTWWFVNKYQALFVLNQSPDTETGGLFFKTALNQLFVGIYLALVCLIGLFFLSRDANDQLSTAGTVCGALTAALLAICVIVQIWLNWKLNPTSIYLSTDLADETRKNEHRYAEEMAAEKGLTNNKMGPVDTRATDGTAVGGNEQRSSSEGLIGGKGATNGRGDIEMGDLDGRHAGQGGKYGGSAGLAQADRELAGGLDENTFNHPALYRDQPTVWLPRDNLGLSHEAVRRGRKHGVLITDDDATIDEKGKVDITRDTQPGETFDVNL